MNETQADITAQEMITAYRVEYGNTYTDTDPQTIIALLEELDVGESISIDKISMTRTAYDSLPEFTGF